MPPSAQNGGNPDNGADRAVSSLRTNPPPPPALGVTQPERKGEPSAELTAGSQHPANTRARG